MKDAPKFNMDAASAKHPHAAPAGKERHGSNKQVKLCGYLRKKRNKIGGGWRRMWFVLQDKLLLSYGSKEEYDNKLVSFKDVVNLVPGTKVHALDGCRFTIETTTQIVYTFHCEDFAVYREWITTLLDSIATHQPAALSSSSSSALAALTARRCFNYSLDNIPSELGGILAQATQLQRHTDIATSYDSLGTQVERAHAKRWQAAWGGYVRLPIAQTTCTGKILERNGLHASSNAQRQLPICKRSAARNPHTNCSGSRSAKHTQSESDDSGDNHQLQCNLETALLSAESRDSCVSEISKRKFLAERPHNKYHQQQQQFGLLGAKRDGGSEIKCDTEITSCSGNNDACKALGVVKDRIQRLSLRGSRDSTVDSLIGTAGERGAVERRTHSILMATTTEEQQQSPIMPKPQGDADGVPHAERVDFLNNNNNTMLEPIYAVIDLKNKYAQRKMRKAAALPRESDTLKRCNSYDSIIQKPCNKYEMNRKSLSLTEDDIDGIYEDGEKFLMTSVYVPLYHGSTSKHNKNAPQPTNGDHQDDEENIYEPIDVRSNVAPAAQHTPSLTPFWKYFTRLKVNSLLHLTRKHRRDERNATYDVLKAPPTQPSAPTKFPTQFTTNIKHKFGVHRRSMQMRMRKFCSRDYEPKPFFKAAPGPTAPTEAATSKSKYRWRSMKFPTKNLQKNEISKMMASSGASEKKRRQFFGSLPHLKRKSRVSLFDVQKVRAGRVESADGGGVRGSCSSGSNYSENSLDYKENSMRLSVNGHQDDIEV